MAKSRDAFRTISEVAEWLDTPAHVLRFWESKFTQVKPVKRAGGRRYYRPDDMMLLSGIKALLHDQGLTIKGAQKLLREKGVKHVASLGDDPEDALGNDADVIDGTATDLTGAPDAQSAVPDGSAQTGNTGAGTPPMLTINMPTAAPTPGSGPQQTADVLPFSDKVALDSSRRTGRIPAIPTNPGGFARPGVLSMITKARQRDLIARSAVLAPLAARLRDQRAAMGAAIGDGRR